MAGSYGRVMQSPSSLGVYVANYLSISKSKLSQWLTKWSFLQNSNVDIFVKWPTVILKEGTLLCALRAWVDILNLGFISYLTIVLFWEGRQYKQVRKNQFSVQCLIFSDISVREKSKSGYILVHICKQTGNKAIHHSLAALSYSFLGVRVDTVKLYPAYWEQKMDYFSDNRM